MSLLVLLVLVVLIAGGGGFVGYRSYGPYGGGISVVGLVLCIVVVWYLLGHRL